MNKEPINPDDPRMTDYLLGELNAVERAEFEARLLESPQARAELASMRVVMDLLGDGLRHEWLAERPAPQFRVLESVPSAAKRSARLPVAFRLAAAAALGGLLLVGSMLLLSVPSGDSPALASAASGTQALQVEDGLRVPRLLLADEIEDLSALDFADGSAMVGAAVDASYLEADAVLPASFQPFAKSASSDRIHALDRVDSYLPPVGSLVPVRGTTGMIERRLGSMDQASAERSASVLVSGYVTMGGGEAPADLIVRGFQPVSISGNPVVNEENELRLLADLNGLQKALSEALEVIPEDAERRAELERVLERSRRVVSQLKKDLSF
jgi:hypothetical protein